MKNATIILLLLSCAGSIQYLRGQTFDYDLAEHSSRGLAWVNLPWVGNARPYKEIRNKIDKKLTTRVNIFEFVKEYRRLAEQDLTDPRRQFAWAYASYRATVRDKSVSAEVGVSHNSLKKFKGPYNYEFARLLFILESRSSPKRELIPLGRRLISHDNKDYSVLYNLVGILDPGRSKAERAEAIYYSEKLVQLQPDKPSAYTALGGTYLVSWFKTRSKMDRDKALSAYNKFLKIAPPNHSFRLRAMNIVSMLKNSKSH